MVCRKCKDFVHWLICCYILIRNCFFVLVLVYEFKERKIRIKELMNLNKDCCFNDFEAHGETKTDVHGNVKSKHT